MRYVAFVSYSRTDKAWARRIHQALERFRVSVKDDSGEWKEYSLQRLFRDDDDLAAAQDLTTAIKDGLAESRFLLLLCSPSAAKSKWVNKEVEYFLETHGSGSVICLLVAGPQNHEETKRECYPRVLRKNLDRIEPLTVDIRRDPFRRVVTRVAASLLGVPFDDLWRRRRRQVRARVIAGICTSVVVVLIFGMVVYSQINRQTIDRTQNMLSTAKRAIDDSKSLAYEVDRESNYDRAFRLAVKAAINSREHQLKHDAELLARSAAYRSSLVTTLKHSAVDHRMNAMPATGFRDVLSVAFSLDESIIVTVTDTGVLSLWELGDSQKWRSANRPPRMKESVTCAAFLADGRLVVSDDAGLIKVLQRTSDGDWVEHSRFNAGKSVSRIAVSAMSDKIATALAGKDIQLWEPVDSDSWRLLDETTIDNGYVVDLEFAKDQRGTLLATVGSAVLLWETLDGTLSQPSTLREEGVTLRAASIDADATSVLAGSTEGKLYVWRKTGDSWVRERAEFIGAENSSVVSAEYVPKNPRIALTANESGVIHVWERHSSSTWLEINRLEGHNKSVRSSDVSASGSLVASGSQDGTVNIWRSNHNGRWSWEVSRIIDGGVAIEQARISENSQVIAVKLEGGQIYAVWRKTRDNWSHLYEGHGDAIEVWSDGADSDVYRLFVAQSNGQITALLGTGTTGSLGAEEIGVVHTRPFSLSVSKSGNQLLAISQSSMEFFFRQSTGNWVSKRLLTRSESDLKSAEISADGSIVTWTANDGFIRQLKNDGDEWNLVTEIEGAVLSPRYSSSSGRLLAVARTPVAVLWDLDKYGEWFESGRLIGHESVIFSADLSADGTRAVTGSEDGTVRVWAQKREADWIELASVYVGPRKGRPKVTAVQFVDGGMGVMGATADGRLSIWDISWLQTDRARQAVGLKTLLSFACDPHTPPTPSEITQADALLLPALDANIGEAPCR